MFDNVLDRFLNYPIQAQRDVRGDPFGNRMVLECCFHARGPGVFVAQEFNASHQAKVIQDDGVKAKADSMHIFRKHGHTSAQGLKFRKNLR